MTTILLRTVIVYIILMLAMRLLGKRQLGELEVPELVTTLLLSEIASLPIADQSIPVLHAVVPLITILTLEMLFSVILLKCPRLKNFASSRPNVLVRHGKIDQRELRRIRISLEELLGELRQAGFACLTEVDYAILEPNGKISVIGKKSGQPPTASDLGVKVRETGMMHTLIADGEPNLMHLRALGLDGAWLDTQLKKRGKTQKQIFFLGRDDCGNLFWIDKENV